MNDLKKIFCLLTIFCLIVMFAGCGGGGGGGTGYTLSPEELEVATAVEAFAASIKNENIDDTMQYVFSELSYPNLTTPGYHLFKSRLENLFSKAKVEEFTITNIGASVNASENFASVRALLTLEYSVDGDKKPAFSENIELDLKKENKLWGITLFSGYNELKTSNFPPAL